MSLYRLIVSIREKLNNTRLTLLVSMLFTVLVSTIFPTPSIIFMAALLITTPITGAVVGKLLSRVLTVTRSLPELGSVGDIISGRLTVYNESALPNFFVRLHTGDILPDPVSKPATNDRKKREKRTAGRPRPGQGDRRISGSLLASGPPLASAIQPVGETEHVVPVLRPREGAEWRPQWSLQRRGVWQMPPARAGVLDPLGVFASLTPRTAPHTITVLPRPVRIARLGFLNGADSGLHSHHYATTRADALDFNGIRLWQPGEAIRRVHWKSTARTGQLHIIEWEETLASDLTILLDVQRQSDDIEALWFEAAITLAASIAVHLLENGYQFQLYCWQSEHGSKAEEPTLRVCHHQARNSSGIPATLRLLAELIPLEGEAASLNKLAQQISTSLSSGTGTALLASSENNWAAASGSLGSGVATVQVTALLLDAASFRTGTLNGDEKSPVAPIGVRTAYYGDSLAEFLEH
jgi:uncharacterized protein (DUF58 family)